MVNTNLTVAKNRKNDEFYTVYDYIQNEMNAYLEYNPDVFRNKVILLPCDDPEWSNFTKFFAQNFERFGLKKLVSTSYSIENKKQKYGRYHQSTLFELDPAKKDDKKEYANGKIFTLTKDLDESGNIDYDDLEWDYLRGDGDFRSKEVTKLRDEADIIVTNPPFSLFREFIAWVFEAEKGLVIIGTQNAITYKEIFPLIKDNRLWLGATANDSDMVFAVPEGTEISESDREKAEKLGYFGNYTRLGNACWYTNLDHGRRHEPLSLMTREDNLKYNKKLINKLKNDYNTDDYPRYDNYDAIEVPFVDAIPSDYALDLGVPISYLSKHNPDQFDIVKFRKGNDDKDLMITSGQASVSETSEREREYNHTSASSSEGRCNGVMGVPITFLSRYNPDQFEIIGLDRYIPDNPKYGYRFTINGHETYARVIIRRRTLRRNGGTSDISD